MLRKNYFFYVIAFVLISFSVFAMSKEKTYVDIDVKMAYKIIMDNPKIIIVDVSPLYDKGHIPNAINAYVGDGTLDKTLKLWDKNETYLVYCHNDVASKLGAKKLIDAGFKNVYRLEGNYAAWLDAKLPIEK